MSKLIELLVENYRYSASHATRTQVNSNLVPEAMAIHKAAADQMRAQRRGFTQGHRDTDQQIAAALQIKLTAELEKVDLLDAEHYALIQAAIKAWQPSGSSDRRKQCVMVRDALLELLPLAHKKQKLEARCLAYQAHLSAEIESGLASEYPSVRQRESVRQIITEAGASRSPVCDAETPRWEQHVQRQVEQLNISDTSLRQAVQKYVGFGALQRTLHSEKPADVQIGRFSGELTRIKPIVDKSRDGYGMICVKALVSILSAGLAIVAGIWSVKGEKATKDLQHTLSEPTNPLVATAAFR